MCVAVLALPHLTSQLLFNRKSGTVPSFTVRSRGHTVGGVSLERLDGFECNLHQVDRHDSVPLKDAGSTDSAT